MRQIAEAQIGEEEADMVEFKAQVIGHEATEKANRIQAWQGLSDWQLADRFDKDRSVLPLTLSIVTIVSPRFLSSNLPAYLGSALVKIMQLSGCCGSRFFFRLPSSSSSSS